MHRRAVIVALLGLMALSACAGPVLLPKDQAESFAKDVEPIVDNTLAGMNEKDYAKHTRDFDADMLEAVDAASFPTMVDDIVGVVGKYQSRTLLSVFDQAEYRTVVYHAQFERDPNVTIRVVFTRDDPSHKIAGLWFDSDALRAAKQPK